MTDDTSIDRRKFLNLSAAAGAGAFLGGGAAAEAAVAQKPVSSAPARRAAPPARLECEVIDCEIEGRIPTELNGALYRVGPDYQYPPDPDNIPFDGDGHMSMFSIAGGRVDYRSRFIRTQRFKAQNEARKALFGVYRNPYSDDPRVSQLSRGTANTHVVFHHGKLMALKEDSPPVVMDPDTLATLDDYYTFGGKLRSETFTAHPKLDPETGEMAAFGYEAKGFGSDDVVVYTFDAQGRPTWEAWIKVPYVSMIHDFVVTQKHIAFFVMPMALNEKGMRAGKVHWGWDSSLPTYLGVMRRGGDGKDLRWFKGPERCATHVMSAFSEGERLYVDVPMAMSNQFGFFPQLHEKFDSLDAQARLTRLSVDLSKKSARSYEMEVMYPQVGELPRIDERYQARPYTRGFMGSADPARPRNPALGDARRRLTNCYVAFDHATRKTSTFFAGDASSLSECVFIPRNADAPEGDGYLLGVAARLLEDRSDLLIIDTAHMEAAPVATVRLPMRAAPQIHGWWSSAAELGGAKSAS